jgi:hypothetical protein
LFGMLSLKSKCTSKEGDSSFVFPRPVGLFIRLTKVHPSYDKVSSPPESVADAPPGSPACEQT